jgi:hypothetical protein
METIKMQLEVLNTEAEDYQLNLLRESLAMNEYPSYPTFQNRLVSDIADLGTTSEGLLIVPDGKWTINKHPNRHDEDTHPTDSQRSRLGLECLNYDSQGRPLHPWFDRMIEDPNIGVVTGKGWYWGWGPNLTVDPIIIKQNHILLVKRNDTHGWALPGGMVDPGETVARAGRRETEEETPDIDYSLRDKEIPLSQQILKLAAYKTIEYKIGETRYILPLELRGELDRDCFSAAFMLDLHRSITKNLSAAERIKYFGKKYEQKLAASVNQLTALWFETPDGDFEQLVSVSESESGGSIVELNEKAVITTNYWKIGHREVAKELKVLTKQPRELEPFLVPNLNDVDQKAGEIQLVDREWLESITTAEKFLKGEPAGFSHQDAIRLLDVSVSIPAILELRKRLEDQQLHFSRSSIVELRKESLRILEWQRFSIALQQRSVKGNLAIKNTSRRRVRLTSGQVAPLQTTDNLFLIVA